MNWMEFVSSVVESLAWPTAIVIAALVFKSEIEELLKRLKSGKVLGTEFEFGDGIQKLEEGRAIIGDHAKEPEMEPSPPASEKAPAPIYGDDRMLSLALEADRNPSYAILTAFEIVKGSARDLIGTVMNYPSKASPLRPGADEVRLLADYEKKNVITPGLANQFRELRDLRNRVAHGTANPTSGEAVAYVENADFVVDLFDDETQNLIARLP
ncbi:hypothetical protein [Nocardioides sp. NPDC006273]|uniref:hypothetical protein n=1 Tax=Nocardioides sp. NPDC006273 TaxID=3155598 RepID=UPI0033ADC9F9